MADLFQVIQDMQGQIGELRGQLQEQTNENTQLHQQIGELRNQAIPAAHTPAPVHAPTPTATQPPNRSTKTAKPDLFYGNRKKLQTFLSQLDLYFFFNSRDFPTDDKRIIFAATYLRDTTAQWFEPYLRDRIEKEPEARKKDTKKVFSSYKHFVTQIKQSFGDLDEVNKARRAVINIHQKTSVADYTTEFQKAAAYLDDWSDRALMDHYYRGLKERVKDQLMTQDDPKTLDKLIKLAIKCDNRLFKRQSEKYKGNYGANTSRPSRPRHTQEGGDAIELDAAQRSDKDNKREKRPRRQ
ncbi:Retrotransposon gag protein [Macrophomina phaseolina MS6]|uniref:Retrotransposon gag protein n=1 Tax=Macrophomina phaseolina (strain MS6) TaxID=1126212 RepID=K2RSV6_MACPH|nr:Retrotransposon gag protein [Macrophomina phaseolina MS6]